MVRLKEYALVNIYLDNGGFQFLMVRLKDS